VIRYLLSPVKRDAAYKSWIGLGPVEDFPLGETRLANFVNPFRRPWMAKPRVSPAMCVARPPAISGLRRELRAPRLPGPLVPAVAAFYVPLPRRRILRRRRTCIRAPPSADSLPMTTK